MWLLTLESIKLSGALVLVRWRAVSKRLAAAAKRSSTPFLLVTPPSFPSLPPFQSSNVAEGGNAKYEFGFGLPHISLPPTEAPLCQV